MKLKTSFSFSANDVVNALNSERACARATRTQYEVIAQCVVGSNVHLTIRMPPSNTSAEDIDALDGMAVRWNAMPMGARPTIVVVDAERSTIRLKSGCHNCTPEVGMRLQVLEQDFFGPVIELWERAELSAAFLAQLQRFNVDQPVVRRNLVTHDLARSLFTEQAAALGLVDYSASYIWGTGGAGKTQTVATLIRAYMHQHPTARILVCATSNKGVDEVVLRVAGDGYGSFRVKRYGSGYNKSAYEHFPDLLPDDNDELSSRHYREYPFDEEDPVLPAGVYAFTVAGTLNRFDKLAEHSWDLVIADEASQIPLSHVLPIMSLADSVVFVGDPEQCSPVAKTSNEAWRAIVGTSAFEFMPPVGDKRMVMLNRQARMPNVVSWWASCEFYQDRLALAHEVADKPDWQAFRQRSFGCFGVDQHFAVVDIPKSGGTSVNRCLRESSARRAVELILEDTYRQYELCEITYITPFNAQANLFRALMREAGLHSIVSSTAHKLQGSQFPIVLLDPVFASGPFMRSVIGRQILNVGATRAQCKLIWLVSDDDLTNPWLTRLREFATKPNQLLGR